MGVEDTPPDIVMRAVERLGQKAAVPAEGKPSDSHEFRQSEQKSTSRTASEWTAPEGAKVVSIPDRLEAEEEASRGDQHKVAEISPAALAAHGIFALSEKNLRTIEEFRAVKRQIFGVIKGSNDRGHAERNRLVMVTSAVPGEGKTHTAINLAFSMSEERDGRVLLIDADVYRHCAIDYLGIRAEKGWVDCLDQASITLDDVILPTNIPNFSILPAGSESTNVPELLSSKGMRALVAQLLARYSDETIIFDSLPCLVSNEPAVLSEIVGQTLFVVAAHQTSKDKVRSSLGMISHCPNINLLLNKAEPVLTDHVGGYGYGYYYSAKKSA